MHMPWTTVRLPDHNVPQTHPQPKLHKFAPLLHLLKETVLKPLPLSCPRWPCQVRAEATQTASEQISEKEEDLKCKAYAISAVNINRCDQENFRISFLTVHKSYHRTVTFCCKYEMILIMKMIPNTLKKQSHPLPLMYYQKNLSFEALISL